MIDYDKLKYAHELVLKLPKYYIVHCVGYRVKGALNTVYTLGTLEICPEEEFDNIDDLIAKLEELTRSELKFKAGDEVYYMQWGEATRCIVESTYWDEDLQDFRVNLRYNNYRTCATQSMIRSTKKELYQSLIDKYTQLRDAECRQNEENCGENRMKEVKT